MLYLLQNVKSYEPVGSTVYNYGYKCEVRENKEVWAEVPKELYPSELAAGRIRDAVKKPAEPVKVPEVKKEPVIDVPEPVIEIPKIEEVIVAPTTVVEDSSEVEVAPAKIDGRSKAAKQFKSK